MRGHSPGFYAGLRSIQVAAQLITDGQSLEITLAIRINSAHVFQPDAGDQSGSLARTVNTTGYEPDVNLTQINLNCLCNGRQDLVTDESTPLGQGPYCPVPEDSGLPEAAGDWGAFQRRRAVGVPVPPKGFPYDPRTSFIESVMTQGYSALRHQQEQFENATQERRRAAFEQFEIAGAHATNSAEAQVTPIFQDIGYYEGQISVFYNKGHRSKLLLSQPRRLELCDTLCDQKLQLD